MIMFNRNGQGFFDFDLELLVELTSIEYAMEVKAVLNDRYIEKVEMDDNGSYITVMVLGISSVWEFVFNKHTRNYYKGVVSKNICKFLQGEEGW